MIGPGQHVAPHDPHAERALITSAILAPSALDALVSDGITAQHFHAPQHQLAWRAITHLAGKGQRPDSTLVADAIGGHPEWADGNADAVNSAREFVHQVMAVDLYDVDITRHAAIVRDRYERRRLLAAVHETLAEVGQMDRSAPDVVAAAQQRILDAGAQRADADVESAYDGMFRNFDVWEHGTNTHGLTTGYPELDAVMGGMRPGVLTLLAARPAMGKSTLALDISRNLAWRQGKRVLIANLEMSSEELATKTAAGGAGIPGRAFLDGGMTDIQHRAVVEFSDEPGARRLHWTTRRDLTVDRLAAIARRHAGLSGLDLLVIDYLQLLTPADVRANPTHQVTQLSRDLKVLAGALDVPVLALSQLSRASETRPGNKPLMSDLRQSGSLEQDADQVLLLHRPDYYDSNAEPGITEVNVAKNRMGRTDTVRLRFAASFPRFDPTERPNVAPIAPSGQGSPPLPNETRRAA